MSFQRENFPWGEKFQGGVFSKVNFTVGGFDRISTHKCVAPEFLLGGGNFYFSATEEKLSFTKDATRLNSKYYTIHNALKKH